MERLLTGLLMVVLGCREAADAVDVDVDQAEQVARQAGDKVASGLDTAREKVVAVGGDFRDAAEQAGRSVGQGATVDAAEADALAREGETAIVCDTPEHCTVSRAYLDRLRANPAFLTGQARVVPYRRDGRAAGLEISALESVPKQFGFRDRDIIRSINGLAVQSLQSAPQLYLQLRSARRFTVVFERGSEQLTREIDVV